MIIRKEYREIVIDERISLKSVMDVIASVVNPEQWYIVPKDKINLDDGFIQITITNGHNNSNGLCLKCKE